MEFEMSNKKYLNDTSKEYVWKSCLFFLIIIHVIFIVVLVVPEVLDIIQIPFIDLGLKRSLEMLGRSLGNIWPYLAFIAFQWLWEQIFDVPMHLSFAVFIMKLLETDKRPQLATSSEVKVSEQSKIDNISTLSLLTEMRNRSSNLADQTLKRSQVNLLSGVVIGFIGLGVFVYTTQSIPQYEGVELSFALLGKDLIQMLPKLTILIFIEVLAGFFLKQYRSSMDEHKYFETLLRQREAVLFFYLLSREKETDPNLIALANRLLSELHPDMIADGQRTTLLEARKLLGENDMLDAIRALQNMAELAQANKESKQS
jgi:hypothetical protein